MADPRTATPVAADARPGEACPVEAPPSWWRRELRPLLEITALCGIVVTQPLLDVTGRSPDFFLFHGAGRVEVLLLVATYTLAPPLLLWGTGMLVGLAGRGARALAHTVSLVLLLAGLLIQVGKHLFPLRGVGLAVAAVAVAGLCGYAHRRWPAIGQFLRFAAVGPLVFVLLFAFTSPASGVVLPGRTSGAGPGAVRDTMAHPPIVMLFLDEFPLVSLLGPDGRIDSRRYPNFAALASGSTWYRNATGVSGWTPNALPAMLTGRYPARRTAPHYSQYPDNMFTALGGVYDIRAQESITQLCPPSRCAVRTEQTRGGLPVLLRESVDLLGQIVSPNESHRAPEDSYRESTRGEVGLDTASEAPTDPKFRWDSLNDNQPARFTEFLAGLRPTPKPTLHFLHLLMPHAPWRFLPSGARYDAPEDLPNDGDGAANAWITLARQRHLAQLGYTDRLIGETLRTLRESGLYDDALLVVTADHGVSFTPGAQGRGLEAIRGAAAEVLWVPMFVKRPGQRAGLVDDRNWEHVDLLPTVADQVGVELPWRTDGISALRGGRDSADKRFYDEPGHALDVAGPATFRAIVTGVASPDLPGPAPELVGGTVAALPVTDGVASVTVANREAFEKVDPAGGRLPALVYGTAPESMPSGTRLVVAVNGRIGAVTTVTGPDAAGRRFTALVTDESLFVPGVNQLELFELMPGGALSRLRI